MVGDPGIEPGVSRLEGVTVPCHTLRPVAHRCANVAGVRGELQPSKSGVNRKIPCATNSFCALSAPIEMRVIEQ